MKFIRIKLPLEPVPQGRARIAIKNGKVWSYYTEKTNKAKEAYILLMKRHEPKKFAAHIPVRLSVTFYRQRSRWVGKSEDFPVRKPDLDNLEKLLLDCMNGLLVEDDAQITKIIMSKRWADGGNWRTPGYIEIELVEDKLTRSEKAARDKWNNEKLKIAQWEKKEKNKQEALDRKYHRNKIKTEA